MPEINELSPEQQKALLDAHHNVETPFDQVKTDFSIPNGWYNHTMLSLTEMLDDNGQYYIAAEMKSHAKDTVGEEPIDYGCRFYVGSNKKGDPLALKPETRLKSFGLGRLKAIAKACDVPTNNQSNAAICKALVGKSWTQRIDTAPYTEADMAAGKKRPFAELGRNAVKLGLVPARLDGTTGAAQPAPIANNGDAAAAAAASTVPGGVFGAE